MNCAGVVNCACVNEDRAGVDVNCVDVNLDEICTCVDNDSTDVDDVCAGVDEVCAAEDVDCGTGITGRPGSWVLRTFRFILIIIMIILHHFFLVIMISSLPLFLNASRIARSCSHLCCDLLLLMSTKAISTGHHQSLLSGFPRLGLVLPVINNENEHKTL